MKIGIRFNNKGGIWADQYDYWKGLCGTFSDIDLNAGCYCVLHVSFDMFHILKDNELKRGK